MAARNLVTTGAPWNKSSLQEESGVSWVNWKDPPSGLHSKVTVKIASLTGKLRQKPRNPYRLN